MIDLASLNFILVWNEIEIGSNPSLQAIISNLEIIPVEVGEIK